MPKKPARKSKSKVAKKKLPRSKGRFYEDPEIVRSKRDPPSAHDKFAVYNMVDEMQEDY